MQILLIEDDPSVAGFAARGLREHGHQVDVASDGWTGLEMACVSRYDVLIVDRMLPGLDGLEIIRSLRSREDATPALVLSALADVDQRVEGLTAGSDDYLSKPFAFSELLARLEALHRRGQVAAPVALLREGDLELDRLKQTVRRAGQLISLQQREFRLLEFLLLHVRQVVTRTMLLEKVWDYHFDPQTNVIDVHISRLRQKIDKGFDQPLIHTLRGAGYMLSAESNS